MDNIDEIKQKVDIISLISEYVALKKAGRNFRANCPFHNEKSPSFVVSAERQIWHCFGCGEGGDVFTFLEKIENIEFVEALRILAKRAGVKLEKVNFDPSLSQKKEKLYQVNHLASEFYHYLLLNHQSGKKALDYILSRGITKKSLETFKIGYAPNAWEGVSKFLLKKGFSIEDLNDAGLIIKDSVKKSYYDRFRGRLMFTLKDHRSNVVGFAGRKIPPDEDKEAKYINSPETPIYIKGNVLFGLDVTKEAIRKENQAIIVEGEIDAISSFQSGVGNVVAIKGSALTDGHLVLLKRFCENLLLSLDADLAGDMAARRGIEAAEKMGFTLKVVKLLFGKDPNDCIQKDAYLWKKSIEKVIPIYDYYLEGAISKYPNNDSVAKKKITEELLPIFGKIDNFVVRDHYLKLLSKKIDVDIDILMMELKRTQKEVNLAVNTTNTSLGKNEKSRRENLEEYSIAMVLQNDRPKVFDTELEKSLPLFKIEGLKKIARGFLDYIKGNPWQIKIFIKTISKELVFLADRLYLLELKEKNNEGSIIGFKKIIKELELLDLKEQLESLGNQMKETVDEKDLIKLNMSFEGTTGRLKLLESSQIV